MKYLLLVLLTCLVACTGSLEPEKDYQLVFGIANLPAASGVLADCSNPLSTAGGLLRIDSRKLDPVAPTGNCNFIATPSPPYDLKRSFRASGAAMFISLPKAGQVRAYNNQLNSLIWTFPATPLPDDLKDFCPTQLALSSSNVAQNSLPSENFLVVLDDPQDPRSGCTVSRDARLVVLNRDGTRKGWLNLNFAARVNGQIRIVASDSEVFILYADNGSSYRLARLLFSNTIDNIPSSSLLISDAIAGVFSNLNINLALSYTQTGLLVGIGGFSGKVLPVSLVSDKFEFGAELRETTETSDFIGATQAIFWNRETGTNNLSIFARERPDTLLRRATGNFGVRITRGFNTQDGIFTSDSSFWGLSSNAFYRLDIFTFPNIQTLQPLTALSNANLTAISWLIGN